LHFYKIRILFPVSLTIEYEVISYASVRVFVTIRGKICTPQWRNWKWAFYTPLKLVAA